MPRILFIGPRFYKYHEIISDGFRIAGYEVDYFDDRASTSFMYKSLSRVSKKLISGKNKKYVKNIMEKTKNIEYDIVFVLYGQSISTQMMNELKKVHNKSKYIFYMYDPINSMPDRLEFSKSFDKAASFDLEDCKKYGFELIPLFYSFRDYEKQEQQYDACFVGTMMPGKYKMVNQMIDELKRNNMRIYEFKYIQSKLVALYYKLTSKDFKKSKLREFDYKRMSMEENNRILTQSKYIIDCPKSGQSGLTIRTFEALSANKKLITTNKSIKEYDIYNPKNIYVYEGKFNFDDIFFNSEYEPIECDIKENYSIDSWVKKILE